MRGKIKKEGAVQEQKVRKRVLAAAVITVFAIVAAGCSKAESDLPDSGAKENKESSENLKDSQYLLTVDGYGVTEDEFLLFLRDQKAATANHYWVEYEMQPDDEFWDTEVDGMTPTEYAKEKALSAVVEAKEEFILADEYGVLEYTDYDGMMTDMEEENQKRASQKEKGETFYGVSEFTPFTYYQYVNGNARAELEKKLEETLEPSEEQLQEVYDANKDSLTLGTVFKYTVRYDDGTEEKISQNTREIGKEDTTTEDLIYNYFAYMQPGETIEDYSYRGKNADITFESVEDQGYMSFEEAKDSLQVFYARSEVNRMISERVENAEIVFNQKQYDALKMP